MHSYNTSVHLSRGVAFWHISGPISTLSHSRGCYFPRSELCCAVAQSLLTVPIARCDGSGKAMVYAGKPSAGCENCRYASPYPMEQTKDETDDAGTEAKQRSAATKASQAASAVSGSASPVVATATSPTSSSRTRRRASRAGQHRQTVMPARAAHLRLSRGSPVLMPMSW